MSMLLNTEKQITTGILCFVDKVLVRGDGVLN